MSEWLKHHVAHLAAPERYVYSVNHWIAFFEEARRRRWIINGPTVADLTPLLQSQFREWRAASGAGGHTISRDLAAVRGALTWSWKHQLIDHPPFIADIPAHHKAPARDRVLSLEEVAALLEACKRRPDRWHVIWFIIIELGTAGRPQAVLELTDANIDLERNLIDPNQPGRLHLRKRRAVVPIAKAVQPWVATRTGKVIKYEIPITRAKSLQSNGRDSFKRTTVSIKKAWRSACLEAKVEGATPKTLRHTMLTWLAERGVPYEQRQVLAGHSKQGTTARNYEHLSPDYLRDAVTHIDAYFEQLAKHTRVVHDGPAALSPKP